MTADLTAARAIAETTLGDECLITRPDPDDLATFTAGELAEGTPLEVYDGPCSIGPSTTSTISDNGGTERLIETRMLHLPAATAVASGDTVTIDAATYIIERVSHRTHEVLRRARLVSAADAHLVPR